MAQFSFELMFDNSIAWPWEKWQSISWPLGTFGPLPHPLGLIWHPFKLIEYYKKCPLVVLKMSSFLPFVAHANHLIFWRIGYSSELLDTKAGNQNSDQNPWRISQEFCGHRTLDNNSDQNPFNNFIIIPWSPNFLIRRLNKSFSKWISWSKSKENFIRIFKDFDAHLNCWILKLASRILIKILVLFNWV